MERTPLELEYSPSSMVDDFDSLLKAYDNASVAARRACLNLTVAYGRGDNELVDVFPTGSDDTMHVFIHGGYWQRLSRRDASFPAVGFNESGYQFAALATLSPHIWLSKASSTNCAEPSGSWPATVGRNKALRGR